MKISLVKIRELRDLSLRSSQTSWCCKEEDRKKNQKKNVFLYINANPKSGFHINKKFKQGR